MHRRAFPGLLGAVLLIAAAGCGKEVPYPSVPATPTATPEAPAPAPAAAATPQASGPRLDVEDLKKDGTARDTNKVFAPSRTSLSECSAGKGGVLRVRIESDDNRAWMAIEPGSSVDGAARRCVLEALSIVDFPEVVAESPASTQPRVFSSLVTISW